MSTISELHNPLINPGFLGRIYANGKQVDGSGHNEDKGN